MKIVTEVDWGGERQRVLAELAPVLSWVVSGVLRRPREAETSSSSSQGGSFRMELGGRTGAGALTPDQPPETAKVLTFCTQVQVQIKEKRLIDTESASLLK